MVGDFLQRIQTVFEEFFAIPVNNDY